MKEKLIVIRNNILLKVDKGDSMTAGGILIPNTVRQKRAVLTGRVVLYGEGYPQYDPTVEQKVWQHDDKDKVTYIPLKVQLDDLVYFFQDAGAEIFMENIEYRVIQEHDILLIKRQEMIIT
jgi:co-chaperonin GroES (HSP10)